MARPSHSARSTPIVGTPDGDGGRSTNGIEAELLRRRAAEWGTQLRALGIRARHDDGPDGLATVRGTPREVREFAREIVQVLGLPRMALALSSEDDTVAIGAFRALASVGVGSATSRMDGEGNESAGDIGVVYMPIPDAPPVPPEGAFDEADAERPPAQMPTARAVAMEALKRLTGAK